MGDRITLRVRGATTVAKKLKLMDRLTGARVRSQVNESAINIQREAKRKANFDGGLEGTGRSYGLLKASIQVKEFFRGLAAQIGPTVRYGAFVEFGTGRRGAGHPHPKLPGGYRHGQKAGMAAQPYLTPAYEEELPKYLEGIEVAVKKSARGK